MSSAKRSRMRGATPNVRRVMYSPSPLLASKTPPGRSKFLVALVGLSFSVLLGRAVYVQIIDSEFFQKKGAARYARTLAMPASRGRIVDRNGQLLATSVPAPSLWAIPKDIEADKSQRRQLGRLLGLSAPELEARLAENTNFVWLRRQAPELLAQEVLGLKLKGVHQVREYKREYPAGESAVHVVGSTNRDERGHEGIELAFQDSLSGRDGTRRVIKDRLGKVVEDIGEAVAPLDGNDVKLSIDSKVQFYAYQRVRDAVIEHKAKAGSVVVLDTRTGEVLALANYPSYSPDDRANLTPRQLGQLARNRAMTDIFEPGSTVKPFIAALALETGRVTPSTVIQTAPGRMTVTGLPIVDAHPHGALTVNEVIQKSSNVGTVKMAMQMQPREMWEMFSQIGFGQRPQIDFPGAISGRLRPHKTWRPIEQATMSYGYGVSASLFQLARAYGVLAHDGELLPASLVKLAAPPAGTKVMSAKTAREVRHMLALAASNAGTAPKAQVVGYSVGGKTGTAQKHKEGSGYADKKYRSWFVGLAPIQNPRIVVAVMVDEPNGGKYYGGDVAAPVFSEVVQQTLRMMGLPPDLDVKPQIMAHGATPVPESF